jgi:hypothetical protein
MFFIILVTGNLEGIFLKKKLNKRNTRKNWGSEDEIENTDKWLLLHITKFDLSKAFLIQVAIKSQFLFVKDFSTSKLPELYMSYIPKFLIKNELNW